MEKVDLKKHKELFKTLPNEEYKSLEQALEIGAYLTPQGVESQGKFGNKELERALPSLYEKFKKIEKLQGKQQNNGFKHYLHPEDWPNSIFALSCGISIGTTIAPMILLTLSGADFYVISIVGLCAVPAGIGGFHLSIPIIAAGFCTRDSHRRKKLEKKETTLANEILKIAGSALGYTEKWVKKQEGELLQMLGNKETQEFANAYNEVEKKLAPLHKLQLHKKIEENLYKQWNKKKKDTKTIINKVSKAKKAGIILDSLEQDLKQELDEKTRHHKKEIKDLKDLREKI